MTKKFLGVFVAFIVTAAILLACVGRTAAFNMTIFDTVWSYQSVQIAMPDGTVKTGKVDQWKDYDDSDMVQVIIDGEPYYTHGSRIVLYG